MGKGTEIKELAPVVLPEEFTLSGVPFDTITDLAVYIFTNFNYIVLSNRTFMEKAHERGAQDLTSGTFLILSRREDFATFFYTLINV